MNIMHLISLLTGKPDKPARRSDNPVLQVLFGRRSCRSFSNRAVSPDELNIILEAGRFAPSTVNLQTWSFITFSADEWRGAFNRPIPFGANKAIIICSDCARLNDFFPEFSTTPHVTMTFAVFNAGLASMNMTIAAEALGLRSIMLSETGATGLLDYEFLKKTLCLPAGVLPLTTLVLGYADRRGGIAPPRQPKNTTVMPARYYRPDSTALADWLSQMALGYKITHPFSHFNKQLSLYRKKMSEAEISLKRQYTEGKKKPAGE